MDHFCQALERNPIVAAIKSREALRVALASPVEVIFLLSGNICNVKEIVAQVKDSGKQVYAHMDLIDGIGRDQYALRFLSEHAQPDGIITTKASFVKPAKELGLYVIQRVFMLDSMSLDTGLRALGQDCASPNAVEILPGILPDIISVFAAKNENPIIAGGLVRTKSDAMKSLGAGAMGVSTSNQALWDM